MSGTNNFLDFARGASPNVIDDATYAALTARGNGFASGVAQSQQLNKVWRQSSVMAAVLGQIIANFGNNATDSDTLANLVGALKAALMGSKASINTISSAATLTFQNVGQLVEVSGTTNYTVTLPVSTACVSAGVIGFHNVGTGIVTISRQSTDLINPSGTTVNTIALSPGDSAELTCNASGVWYLTDGSVSLKYAGVMSGANWTTPAQFDNTTKLATSAFVQRAIGSYSGVGSFLGNGTLDASNIGQFNVWDGNGTLTLPNALSFPLGSAFTVFKYGANPGVIAAATGTQIQLPVGPGSTFTTAPAQGFLHFTCEGNKWDLTGDLTLPVSPLFASSVTSNGYQKLPTGLIIQWGISALISPTGTVTVTFPITFPNDTFSITLGRATDSSNAQRADLINFYSRSGFSVNNGSPASNATFNWIAIGY